MSFINEIHWATLLSPLGILAVFWVLLQYLIQKINPEIQPFLYHVRTSLSRLINLSILYVACKHILISIPFPDNWEKYSSFLLLIFAVLGVTSIFVKIAQNLISYSADRNNDPSRASSILKNFCSIIIWIIGILILLNSAGIPITPLVTALGVGGLAVALALQDPMSNLFAGLQILMSQQIRPGDFIQISSGESGTIKDISWRTTVIQTSGEDIIIIPNNKISTSMVTNKSWLHSTSYFSIIIQISYDSDLSKVKQVALEAAIEVAKAVGSDPKLANDVLVRYDSFGGFGINLKIIMKCTTPLEIGKITDALVEKVHKRFREENIEIPYPTQKVLMTKE